MCGMIKVARVKEVADKLANVRHRVPVVGITDKYEFPQYVKKKIMASLKENRRRVQFSGELCIV